MKMVAKIAKGNVAGYVLLHITNSIIRNITLDNVGFKMLGIVKEQG